MSAQSKKKRRDAPIKTPPKLPESVLALLHQQHGRLRQAMGIVSCARYASESMVVPRESRGEPELVKGLEAAFDILCEVTEVLEDLIPQQYFLDRAGE